MGSVVEWSRTGLALGLDVGMLLQQKFDDRGVAMARSPVEWRPIGLVAVESAIVTCFAIDETQRLLFAESCSVVPLKY